ncbi:MAG: glycosyltransferase family 4 protein [bacterium]
MRGEALQIVFVDVSGRGGIAHHVFLMTDALAGQRVDVTVATTKNHESDLHRSKAVYKKILFPHHRFESRFCKGAVYLLSLIRMLLYLLHSKPDIVHWHEIKIPSVEYRFIRFLQRMGVRFVLSAHDVLHPENPAVTRSLERLYCCFNSIIAHTIHSKRQIVNLFSVSPESVRVIPVGEYSRIAGELKKKGIVRKRFGIPADKKVLLFFGYIREYKGLDLLLRSLSAARLKMPDVFLIIAGESKVDFRAYEKEIEDLKLSDMIYKNIGYIPMADVSDYFSAADAVVMPYRNIYQSGVLYFTFAHRRPVIATDVGELSQMIEEGKSGFVVPAGDCERMSETIVRALSDISALERMGEYAYHTVREKYSWRRIADETVRVYKDVMTRR